jgi:hypothetical protein
VAPISLQSGANFAPISLQNFLGPFYKEIGATLGPKIAIKIMNYNALFSAVDFLVDFSVDFFKQENNT